jgi:DNA-directed RNA polymerase specialized sigma24 family protein
MIETRSDAEAIAASLEDPERFADVFHRHFPPVHRFARRRVGELADDIAAETFAVAFRERAR